MKILLVIVICYVVYKSILILVYLNKKDVLEQLIDSLDNDIWRWDGGHSRWISPRGFEVWECWNSIFKGDGNTLQGEEIVNRYFHRKIRKKTKEMVRRHIRCGIN